MRATKRIGGRWVRARDGLAALEFALVFPVLMMLLMGVYEFGSAFLVNQRTISSSQMMADLLARNVSVTTDDIDGIIAAGAQAMRPFPLREFGYDIISIRFVGDNNDEAEAEVCWRRTINMDARDNEIENVAPIATLGQGMVIVTVAYDFRPTMGARLMKPISMRETAYARGRRSSVVSLQEGNAIGCVDD